MDPGLSSVRRGQAGAGKGREALDGDRGDLVLAVVGDPLDPGAGAFEQRAQGLGALEGQERIGPAVGEQGALLRRL